METKSKPPACNDDWVLLDCGPAARAAWLESAHKPYVLVDYKQIKDRPLPALPKKNVKTINRALPDLPRRRRFRRAAKKFK